MRVAIVAESFLPHMNGVTGSVLQILNHLERTGHDAHVIAPAARQTPVRAGGAHVDTVASLPLPGYRNVRVALASVRRVRDSLHRFEPDVVHLASPFALGWPAVRAAESLGLPTVAAYQTDVAAYASRYGVAVSTSLAESHLVRLHRRATLTLAPSSDAEARLAGLGVDRLRRWGRGVDAVRFHPGHRDGSWAPRRAGAIIVGYVGRLAPEKQIEDLVALHGMPGVRLVIVGDGPSRAKLRLLLPDALFLGHVEGQDLASAMASFDIFVHPGESETFGQTLQEAQASGVPVIATGAGGPRDLVRMGIDGWLYRPGDLDDLRMRVRDLAGDARKRQAFGRAGRAAVEHRSWAVVCDLLLGHFDEARRLRALDKTARVRRTRRVEPAEAAAPGARRPWQRYVALGDSLTEGLCDPDSEGVERGWADRLARLLAADRGLHYTNLAVRSRRVDDVCGPQMERAMQLRPDLVSIFIGANDLVRLRVDIDELATRLEGAIVRLRESGADVVLVTPFLPRHPASVLLARRFGAFASVLADVAGRTDALLIDADLFPEIGESPNWAGDLVHLSSRGHRMLAYRVAERLGVPHAEQLGALDQALHESDPVTTGQWWARHALPWMWRRLRGRSAGDGRVAKHAGWCWIGRDAQIRPPAASEGEWARSRVD